MAPLSGVRHLRTKGLSFHIDEWTREIANYTAHIEARSYYFISEDDARLVDVDAMEDITSDASHLTEHRGEFRKRVFERDRTCVMTGDMAIECDACHILPHSKGSHYIINVLRHRRGTNDSAIDLNDINDPRNGLLLLSQFHRAVGASELAFLKTPNFALGVDDIPYHLPREESPASRLTIHHFTGVVTAKFAPHNSDARPPQDASDWPSTVILNMCYAIAVLKAWSPKPFTEYAQNMSRSSYYEDDQASNDVSNGNGRGHANLQTGDRVAGQHGPKCYVHGNRTPNIPPDQPKGTRRTDLMDCVSAIWMWPSKEDKSKQDGSHASSLVRNENVKA